MYILVHIIKAKSLYDFSYLSLKYSFSIIIYNFGINEIKYMILFFIV